jgi:hypothetical protein
LKGFIVKSNSGFMGLRLQAYRGIVSQFYHTNLVQDPFDRIEPGLFCTKR